MIKIRPLVHEHIDAAAAMFAADFARLRRTAPVLPRALEDPKVVAAKLEKMAGRGLAALRDGRLCGYLAWWVVDRFRGSERRAAYVPEWAHVACSGEKADIYRMLYRAAAALWTEAGCAAHAITLLADDLEASDAWFWNGFGLAVVDAVRPAAPLEELRPTSLAVRGATLDDAQVLAELDAEHVRHYTGSPVYMAPPHGDSSADFEAFLGRPKNGIWLALDPGAREMPAGFMRFTGYDFDAVAALQSEAAAFCNAAYVRPCFRGRGAGRLMLGAGLEHYAGVGLDALYTNFESFNPEAAGFWPRYFRPVCLSLLRVPEVLPVVLARDKIG